MMITTSLYWFHIDGSEKYTSANDPSSKAKIMGKRFVIPPLKQNRLGYQNY